MRNGRVPFLKWLGLMGAVVVLFTGCPEDAADIVEPRATALDFDVAPLAGVMFPRGAMSVDRLFLAAFDTTVADAFGRETGRDFGLDGGKTGQWVFGPPAARGEDGRAPTLIATTPITSTAAGLLVNGPAIEGVEHYFFIISGRLEGLPPNTDFTVALVRLGTQINAELDQAAVLQGLPVTQPDSLIILNPNPAGDPNVILGVGGATVNRGDTINVFGGANPLIVGRASSDASGASDFGIVVRCDDAGGTPVFYCSDSDPISDAALEDSVMFGRNDGLPYVLPRYNYVVLYEGVGVPTDATPQVARWQTGQDLDLTGQPINNGAAPFPSGAFTTAQLIAAPGGAGAPDSVTLEIFNAEALTGGAVYQAWLYNRDESPPTLVPATATYQRVAIVRDRDPVTGEVLSESDSVMETVSGATGFTGQLTVDVAGKPVPQEVKHRLIITDATTGGGSNAPGLFTDIIVSLEAGAASAPSAGTALWFQYTDQNGTPTNFFDDVSTSGSLGFGHFDLQTPADSRVFAEGDFTQSSGVGGVLDVGGNLVQVSVDLRNLPLPPGGYFYEGWLYNPETGNALSMGPLTTLPPDTVSLFDADIDQSLPAVTSTGIRFANASLVLDDPSAIVSQDGNQFTPNLVTFLLTLEPKLGVSTKNVAELEVGSLPMELIIKRLQP
jgi:hypothetical protein